MCLPSVCRDCNHRFNCNHRPNYVPPIGAGGPSPIGTGSSTEYDPHMAELAARQARAERDEIIGGLNIDR